MVLPEEQESVNYSCEDVRTGRATESLQRRLEEVQAEPAAGRQSGNSCSLIIRQQEVSRVKQVEAIVRETRVLPKSCFLTITSCLGNITGRQQENSTAA